MKNWFSQVFGGKKGEPKAPGQSRAQEQRAGFTQPAESGPVDTRKEHPASTILAEPSSGASPPGQAENAVAAEWRVGDVILGLYEVKQIHEGGGMGLVYRVHHRGWNMDLAVKSPRREYFQNEAQKENFTHECETWINLGLHSHIVSCQYVRVLGGIPRVFAEYVEGGSLKEWIDSRKLYEGASQESLKRILDIAIQMAWGFASD